ncbi:MAG: PfkB family carbohydrate kinase [Treponema sp.]|jgi:1-phosphofructokinase/tagatose 6-phosphate kinase|nr:PfkB family carbohydrate kinase [Treponema sp.]
MKSILSICLNPTIQKTLVFSNITPDKVNRTVGHRLDASGKGINVSRVLTQLGKKCVHLTQLGGSFRAMFLELCALDGLAIEWVESHSPIRFCYTLINNKDKSVTELVEEGDKVEAGTEDRLMAAFDRLLPDISTVIISGSKAAGFSDSLLSEMVRKAKAQAAKVILDLRGKDLLECLPYKPDIIKPNYSEFVSTFMPEFAIKKAGVMDICRELTSKYETQIILTRGTMSIWCIENGQLQEFPIDRCEPLNTTGSGDAFTAGLASALEDGLPLKEAIAEGARCGKLNAGLIRPGVIY